MRERERERDRGTDRETNRETDRGRETYIQTGTNAHAQTHLNQLGLARHQQLHHAVVRELPHLE